MQEESRLLLIGIDALRDDPASVTLVGDVIISDYVRASLLKKYLRLFIF